MRLHVGLLILMFLAAAAGVSAAPRIHCDEPVYQFGSVIGQDEIDHVFILKNTGDSTLTIARVRPTCGCTTAGLTSYTLEPGATAELTTRLSLKGRRGEQRKPIYIDCDDPENPQYRLELIGEVRHLVDFRPSQAYLQRTPASPTPSAEVQVTFNSEVPRAITSINTDGAPSCIVTVREERPGFLYTLVIQARSNLNEQANYVSENIVLLTDYPEQPQVAIPVIIHMMRDVVVAPNQLTVPMEMPPSGQFQQQILVRNRTPQPLEILAISGPTNALTITSHRLAEGMHRLEVTFHDLPPELDGKTIDIDVSREGAAAERYVVPIHMHR